MTVQTHSHNVFFTSNDGLKLAGEFAGDPKDPPVVLLHGGGQTRHAWKKTQMALAEAGFYTLAMDLRGHGESDWSEAGNYQPANFKDDLKIVIDSLSAPPVVVGASLGGIVTLVFQGECDEVLTRAVVLVDIAPKVESKGTQRILTFMRGHNDGFASLEDAAKAVAAYLHHRKSSGDIEGLKKNLRRRADGRYYWHWDPALLSDQFLVQVGDEARLLAAAKNIKVPLLLVRGMLSDVVTANIMEEFLAQVPGAQFVDVPTAGHMVAGDSNDVFAEALIGFLRNSHLD
jgi:pimeloyl-ACP methyl ester carboxylesterase